MMFVSNPGMVAADKQKSPYLVELGTKLPLQEI